jgi:glutamate racemase
MKIGFFDSGLGGLTVMKAVVKHLPAYDYEFYGDTQNLPYGEKTEEEIYALTKKGVTHLFERGCLLVVIACNTASAQTLRKLQDTFVPEEYKERKILGVIIPMVETVIEAGKKHTLLLATTRTVNSGKYEREFEKHVGRPQLTAIATPELVPLIESGDKDEAARKALEIIHAHIGEGIDNVVLGCTHYGLLKEAIVENLETPLSVFAADELIPKKLEDYLYVHTQIRDRLTCGGTRSIHLTLHSPHYDSFMAELLGGVMLKE